MNPIKLSPTLNSIQLLRAIAAWIVVFHHFVQIYFQMHGADFFSSLLARYGNIGVDFFFVISGFVMYKSTNGKTVSVREFIFNRIARIVPAYWFYTCVTGIIILIFNGVIPKTDIESVFLLKSLFFIPAQNPSGIGLYPLLTVGWTLNYELAFYAAFATSLLFMPHYRLITMVVGIFLLQTLAKELGGDFGFYANRISFEFLIGVVVGIIHSKGLLRIPLSIAIIFSIGSVALILAGSASHHYLKVGIPCAVIVAAALSQEKYFVQHGWLTKLGDWSYSTYLCHVIVLSIGFKITQIYSLNSYLMLAICCPIILILSWISYTYIEQRATAMLKMNFGPISRVKVST